MLARDENGFPIHIYTNPQKDNTMEFSTYTRKPFTVEATRITAENIEEVAKLIGDIRTKEDGTPFIVVNRRIIPSISRVYVGYWLTQMGDNLRCYSDKVFTDQFIVSSDSVIVHGDAETEFTLVTVGGNVDISVPTS